MNAILFSSLLSELWYKKRPHKPLTIHCNWLQGTKRVSNDWKPNAAKIWRNNFQQAGIWDNAICRVKTCKTLAWVLDLIKGSVQSNYRFKMSEILATTPIQWKWRTQITYIPINAVISADVTLDYPQIIRSTVIRTIYLPESSPNENSDKWTVPI